MRDCERGCLTRGQHIPDCLCTPDCADHKGHCEGCAPKPAESGNWCHTCTTQLASTLLQLPALADQMARMPGGRPAPRAGADHGDTTRTGTKVDQASPSPAWDLAEETYQFLYAWAVALADALRQTGPFTYTHAGLPIIDQPRRFAGYLTERIPEITAQEDAEDMRKEAMRLHYQLTQGTGQDAADQPIRKPCPECDRKTLYRPNGKDHIECRNKACTAPAWASRDFDRLALVVAS